MGDMSMECCQLGRSGLSVSRICLGTLHFGPNTAEAESHAIMDGAHEVGINLFDTSNGYGWKRGEGWTEQIIGRRLAQGGGRFRDRACHRPVVRGQGTDDVGLTMSS
jgi:aryl-alcohol dehydrogenase-like predicted oxidoreductase